MNLPEHGNNKSWYFSLDHGQQCQVIEIPHIFPFHLVPISAEYLASLSPRLDILRHGLDDTLVMLCEKNS
jgi:hypothetical protein